MIRTAKSEDLQIILSVYETARSFMKENGNPNQWGNVYPPTWLVMQDLEQEKLFAVENEKGKICGVFYFSTEPEPLYEKITDGNWREDGSYGTIHRVASDGTKRGIFSEIVSFGMKRSGVLRIDTHPDNLTMQHVLEKNGFYRCGIVPADDGTIRFGYEKKNAQ